jgi:NAD(P)-dependent dehydrogenase (short-subunit alcohol dehydrogenase family)
MVSHRPLDVTDETAWNAIVEHARSDHGRLDVPVHAAGIAMSRPLLKTSLGDFQQI